MEIRAYRAEDRDGCLAVFDSNVPDFFAEAERGEFAAFLEKNAWPYVVMEHEGAVVGCGGWVPEGDGRTMSMTWGMVRGGMHGLGLGRLLLLHRLREITKAGGCERVRLATSQRTAGFFAKQGFKVVDAVKDGFAPGIDRVEMAMKLEVCW
jgi:N-acetylglutamate synthase-like GNAT family acetyltransferase